MVKVFLRRLDERHKDIEIPKGKTTIGRGPLLACGDKKVSRNHAILEVGDEGVVNLLATHVNPCFYQPQAKGEFRVLKKDDKTQILPGDAFLLLPGSFRFKVVVKEDKKSTSKEVNKKTKKNESLNEYSHSVMPDLSKQPSQSSETEKKEGSFQEKKELEGSKDDLKQNGFSKHQSDSSLNKDLCHQQDVSPTMEGEEHVLPENETILPISLKAVAQPSSMSKSSQQPSLERMVPFQLSPEKKSTSTYLENKTVPELSHEGKLTTLFSAEKKDVLQLSKRKRTLPAWLVQIATSPTRKLETKKPVLKKKENVPSHNTSPKYEFSESEEDKTPKRASRKNRQSRQKISLDDFIVSDEEWEETDNRKRKKSVRKGNDSGSDWEVENRKKRWNKECNSSSDSGGGHKKKKTSRKVINTCASNRDIISKKVAGNQSLGSQKGLLSPETNDELLAGKQKSRKSCRFGENCYRKNPLHFEEFSHPGDADFVFVDEAEDVSSDNEDSKPDYQNNLKQKKKYSYSKKNRPKRKAARKGRKWHAENENSDQNSLNLNSFLEDDSDMNKHAESDSDWNPGEDSDEDIGRLVKEAESFTKNKHI
ncbi:uncharacterized protein LOC143226704 isoform X2 [Tachypleus tridentatus]|uniref:uncharacterized protein LOC143226704 isoform X2 n=1 Tax=Tachypleus tridentatus TaxID=6853 RepID=UPI003FD6674E